MSHTCSAADVTRTSPDIQPGREDIYQFSEIRYEQTTHGTSIKSLPVPGLTNTRQSRLQINKPQTKPKPKRKHEFNLSKSEKSFHNSQHTSIQLCPGVTRDTSKLPMKRTRTPFTDLQLLELGNYFKTNKFLTVENSQKQKQTINSSEIVPIEVSYFHPEELKHMTSPTTQTTEESVLYNYVW